MRKLRLSVTGRADGGRASLVSHLVAQGVARGIDLTVDADAAPAVEPAALADALSLRIGVADAGLGAALPEEASWSGCDALVVDRPGDVDAPFCEVQQLLANQSALRLRVPCFLADCRSGEGVVQILDWLVHMAQGLGSETASTSPSRQAA